MREFLSEDEAAKTAGKPPPLLVFSGDYVDRGRFTWHVLALLYALIIEFGEDRLVMIAGNHESFPHPKSHHPGAPPGSRHHTLHADLLSGLGLPQDTPVPSMKEVGGKLQGTTPAGLPQLMDRVAAGEEEITLTTAHQVIYGMFAHLPIAFKVRSPLHESPGLGMVGRPTQG